MKTGISPWLRQLKNERKTKKLLNDLDIDVTIVGAGIAGIATSFFILRNTDKKVALIEKNKLAHGATGHNAGQIVSYFERPYRDMVKEFGADLVKDAYEKIENTWTLLDIMYTDAGLNIPFSRFEGHAGMSSKSQVEGFLEDIRLKKIAGLRYEDFIIADDAPFLNEINPEYADLYQIVPREKVLERLETDSNEFYACMSYQKGVVNSALFCEEVLEYLLKKYEGRFDIYEDTSIDKIVLKKDHALLDAGQAVVKTEKVVLCTNGFSGLRIFNESGLDIDTKFHHNVNGKVGYMSGYLEEFKKPSTAISYFTDPDASAEDPYFYLTRREYEYEKGTLHNLICIGGPDQDLENKDQYVHDFEYPDHAKEEIDNFVRTYYETSRTDPIDYKFTWHGLMGYTPNRVRLIGPEPKNPTLMYNLGCNGTGIMSSVYGGQKISEFIQEKNLPKSIFDPK